MAKYTPSRAGLRWNDTAKRYVGANGRFLDELTIRRLIDEDVANKEAQLRAVFVQLRDRQLTIAQWQTATARLVKDLHIANYAAALGGFHKLTPQDLGRIGATVKKQYRYLNRFARTLAARPELIERPRMEERAASYALAGRVTYEETRQRRERLRGALWAMRLLHAAESCPGCRAHAYRWLRAEEMPPIGGLECNVHCRCTIIYSYREAKPSNRKRTADAPATPGKRKVRVID